MKRENPLTLVTSLPGTMELKSEILSDFLAVEEKWIWKHRRRRRFEGEKRG